MPRPRLGEQPMTSAERQSKRREQFREMREALEAILNCQSVNDARETAARALANIKGVQKIPGEILNSDNRIDIAAKAMTEARPPGMRACWPEWDRLDDVSRQPWRTYAAAAISALDKES